MGVVVLGIRAEPAAINWAVVEGSSERPLLRAHDKSAAPVQFSEAESLAWLRLRVLDLLNQYAVQRVAVKYPENFRGPGAGRRGVQESEQKRLRVEGVVLEAAHSHNKQVIPGAWATIS